MSSYPRVALVTGANKGIGFAIARDLCRQFSGDVSIRALRDFLRKEYGGLDVLVNNAGIAFKSRVVNVSSTESLRALKNCSPKLQEKFRSETITEEELVGLMNKFVEDTKNGMHIKEGWPNTVYGVTKIGITVLSRIHARKLSEERRGDKILLNACCPGWVRTDMAGPRATKSPEEGAETPVYLALLPADAEGPHGEFVTEKKVEQCAPRAPYPTMSCTHVALVTGANKGIGFAITRDLCWQFSGEVLLTARDTSQGQTAMQQLQAQGLSPRFHQLDINHRQSIRTLRDFLHKEYGGPDLLVNNAGIAHMTMCSYAHVTLVTRANKGISFTITCDLCWQCSGDVLPLAQDEVLGRASMQQLQTEGISPCFHQLDIDTCRASLPCTTPCAWSTGPRCADQQHGYSLQD
ncbi:hypothetical protein HPG69_016147 [Diceros bicornis minor]|uniref:Carbonyl reductase [NADPH] 1 n=1 Tax=Diceros bicornis minor TaxID=77932 RepID=A0A7J7FHX4_DICBM|nr:hypothetical protein HPG69_016147 [Diceros bicornis minor]